MEKENFTIKKKIYKKKQMPKINDKLEVFGKDKSY